LGGGIEWKPCSKIIVDLGALFTNYDDASKGFKDPEVGNYVETYKKHNVGYAIGLAYKFGSVK
jgi:opacity protein-like surface antigen